MAFGNCKTWVDVEGDETTFDKKPVKKDGKNLMEWEQWVGMVQRGQPDTLILHRLRPELTEPRAPGPGAIRKHEWQPIAEKHLSGRKLIFHTDSARSYKLRLPMVVHDHVVHCKQRVKVKGKWMWKAPKYVSLREHKLPDSGKVIKVKAGTQIIDRVWRFFKSRLDLNQHSKAGSARLREQIRSIQYEYWNRNKDLWVASGDLCAWLTQKFVKPVE